jgi:uncharacterized protein (TIGR00251 family)
VSSRVFDVASDGAVIVRVHTQPGATHPGLAGVHGDALKVRVREVAERGRANRAVEAVLADVFDVPRSSVAVTAGTTAQAKRVRVTGVTPDRAASILRATLSATQP